MDQETITWLSPAEAAKRIPKLDGKHVSLRTVWRLMDSGQLGFERLGKRRAISIRSVESLLKSWNGARSRLAADVRLTTVREHLAQLGVR